MKNASKHPEYTNHSDCTNQCKSRQHGDIITSAISKRGVSDTDLCAFLSFTCCRCESVVDFSGRTALHVAASCGRLHLVKWLVCNRNADIDVKDKESGYTALHRSIFYGQIHVAVELVKLGASTSLLDKEFLTAFEHSMIDGLKPTSDHGELFYWGSNNNSLFGSLQARDVPDLLDFHKHYPEESVKKICIGQFHIVIMTNSGNIYSCGHGREGRLGLGNEGSYVVPHIVKISNAQKEEPIYCVDIDISRDHSIFLLSDKTVYSCGFNQYMVLGHVPPPDRVLTPKVIKNLSSKSIVGICARRYHSLAWNTKTVYAWGLNAGQFGQKAGENNNHAILAPKPMHLGSNEANVLTVGASDGATVVVTDRGTIYVFHEYQCKKIASKQSNVAKVCVIGGNLDQKLLDNVKHKDSIEIKVAVLLNSGDVLLWQETDQQLCRCIYSVNRPMMVKHIYLNRNELLLVSEYGEGFKGNIRPRKRKKTNQNEKAPKSNEKDAFNKLLEKDDCIFVNLEKISRIYRAFFIQSDFKGRDYCIVQVHPYKQLENTFLNGPAIKSDLQKIIGTTTGDGVEDVTFNLKNGRCLAHRYVLLSRCPSFANNMKYVEPVINLPDIEYYVFQQFLTFVYTGNCDFAHIKHLEDSYIENRLGLKNDRSTYSKHKAKENVLGPIESLRRIATDFECTALVDILNKRSFMKNNINLDEPFVFNRSQFQEIYDITLKCADGNLKAHRCILSARMEYFENLLSNRWSGNDVTEVNLSFPKKTVEFLLDFLYTDSLPTIDIDIDNLLKLLIMADQFFVAKLKNLCESLLSEKLSFKHTVEILSFAHMYNANKLKRCCIKFITLNIQAFLDMGYLNDLPDEILEQVSSAYFTEKNLSYRVITPYSVAVSDEELVSIAHKYPVLTVISENKLNSKNEQKKRNKSHRISFSKKDKISLDSKTIDENVVFITDTIVNNDRIGSPNNDSSKRVNAINKAANLMKSESIPINYVKLNVNDSSSSFENSFMDSSGFPELGSSFGNGDSMGKNSLPKHESKHKMVRISQKQRKKLNSESDDGQSKPVSETKKSPWKTNFDFGSPISSPEAVFSFSDIILNEKKQKENLVKISNKLLHFTQKEDKAIEELRKFYNVDETVDEIISIQRVDTGTVASPSWVPKTKEIRF